MYIEASVIRINLVLVYCNYWKYSFQEKKKKWFQMLVECGRKMQRKNNVVKVLLSWKFTSKLAITKSKSQFGTKEQTEGTLEMLGDEGIDCETQEVSWS
jgi:uncharacterized lipoprotein NlpE involved in copper resistance